MTRRTHGPTDIRRAQADLEAIVGAMSRDLIFGLGDYIDLYKTVNFLDEIRVLLAGVEADYARRHAIVRAELADAEKELIALRRRLTAATADGLATEISA